MIRQYSSHTEIKRFVFLTEQEYILYFGQHYEDSVQRANTEGELVIRARNGNGIVSSLPIDRANYLIEKYHKLLKRNPSLALSSQPQDVEEKPAVASN
ncbi:hypothetical protein [Tunicatimonas pelagia]|uniref:hypothetical protein n=1 Tax=Tunicatimonas pelagia TaxID=931531 RepID=UPI002667178F|nr:hypothetical protein [Tunicatimonas pelagia]WKN43636.1 hypothetical protein P0M28_01465 [Tunicatimonas pelagia]